MISRLRLLRNIGLFDSVSEGANIAFGPLVLIYAENGRGKTTLAAVLRSLATGNPEPISERHRLGAPHPPHIIVDCNGGPSPAIFQNNAWNHTLANMLVFDDMFVDQNVYSGLVVGPEHRQNLHELILGAQAVALTQQLQGATARIEAHNRELRNRADAIPAAARGELSVDEFCGLAARADIDAEIQATERTLGAAREQDPVRDTPVFEALALPAFDVAAVERVIQEDLSSLDAAAAARVQDHVAALGPGGETWIDEGMRRLSSASGAVAGCPFCAQDLADSPVLDHYRAYFSADYADLKLRISQSLAEVNRARGSDLAAALERALRVAGERRQFWSRFCDVPEISVDTEGIARDWRVAHEAVVAALNAKQAAPLDRMALAPEARAAGAAYEAHRETIAALNNALRQANEAICLVKEQAAAGNAGAIAADLAALNAVKARHTPAIAALCQNYLDEKAAKIQTEQQREQAQGTLNQYRTNVFPGYQTAVNLYLQRFSAGFRLDNVISANTRGGPACNYNVIINNTPVAVAGGMPSPGEPSFRNTLSAGDRNTLALAFFFACLDQDPGLANKVIVIDDPVSSLDEHRSLTTVQEMRRLAGRAVQVILLSHSKPFLCRIWENANPAARVALEVARDGTGSTLRAWDVNRDCVTENDRQHEMLRGYLRSNSSNLREVARAIRPVLEAFTRVAYPEHFPPGSLLGPFRYLCEQRLGTPQEILNRRDTEELRDLVEYANEFHHDTNPACDTEVINDAQLRGFVERALAFTHR